ncbi:MAG: PilT protein domain-containing protein [Comamonadaceae bacterium]|nr:MAG: PilT protein domain-containing protein [Comamonadaceae bacterium]
MSQTSLLDASAILAFLQGEPGQEVVRQALQSTRCLVTAANQTEVITRSLDRGGSSDTIALILANLDYTVIDTLATDGAQAGWLRSATRQLSLSLGDRLCLAAAQRLKTKVLTADRPWLTIAAALELDIVCIRPDAH